jgi:hypothetical protein
LVFLDLIAFLRVLFHDNFDKKGVTRVKFFLIALMVACFFTLPAMAKKPEWAGEGKPTKEQLEAHKKAMKAKAGDCVDERLKGSEDKVKEQYEEGQGKAKKEKRGGKKDKQQKQEKQEKQEKHIDEGDVIEDHDIDALEQKGLEMQTDKKADRVQKQIDKGSSTGQQSREDNSKQWWNFW